MYRFLAHFSFTWAEGKAEVRSVSWVSSVGRLRGTLRTNAAWSGVAAQAVILKPARHSVAQPQAGGGAACGGASALCASCVQRAGSCAAALMHAWHCSTPQGYTTQQGEHDRKTSSCPALHRAHQSHHITQPRSAACTVHAPTRGPASYSRFGRDMDCCAATSASASIRPASMACGANARQAHHLQRPSGGGCPQRGTGSPAPRTGR